MALSLNQRRFQEAFKKDYYANWENEMKAIVGDKVNFDIDWDSFYNFTSEGDAETVSQFWAKVYFEPLKSAVSQICVDDMGKEALQSKLNTIAITGATESWESTNASFVDGVFKIDQMPFAEKENSGERTDIWKDIIEKGL
jgi:hypothetical protein